MKHLDEGLHDGVPMQIYVADPCPEPSLSASTLRALITKSPRAAHHRHPRLGGHATFARAADLGSAAHAVLLEGPEALHVITEYKDYRTNAAKAARQEAYDAGKIPIFEREMAAVEAMVSRSGPALADRGAGRVETTIVWREGTVWCRARADWLLDDVVDYKTAKVAEPGYWIRKALFRGGYDISAAWYLRGLRALGEPREEYLFLVQEVFEPWDYSWIAVDEETLERANRAIDAAVRQWRYLLEREGDWPGYSKRVHVAELPAYRAEVLDEFATRTTP